MRWFDILEQPMVSFIIMGIFSTAAAVIFFQIGGSVARVTAEDNQLLQASIEAGGALAGFIIVFSLSHRAYTKIRALNSGTSRRLREYILRVPPDDYNPQDPGLACKYKLYDQSRGGWDDHWKAAAMIKGGEGSLKIFVAEMRENHTIRIQLQDSQGNIWQSAEDLSFGITPVYLERVGGHG